ncbi:hypothetical protein [Deinococcus alpinitundrae]|uniref:hypothetical protein n=1 Tax=Deinococcus alpinitundrae TaxID=468913 RepID=UPI00192A4219|nr:hypothetical protein [Deinococcus alpinitundrae]
MVKRRGLADLLRTEAQHLQQSPEETESVVLRETESQTLLAGNFEIEIPLSAKTSIETEVVSLREIKSVSNVETDSVTLPKYQRLVRKEARLHEVQYDELTRLARELNRRKHEVGEIITANTLLRVATELLLRRRSELHGDTEEELLASLQ